MTPRHFAFPDSVHSKDGLLPPANKGMGLSRPRVSRSCVGAPIPVHITPHICSFSPLTPKSMPTLDTLTAVVGT